MISAALYLNVRAQLADAGYAAEYEWCQNVKEPKTATDFYCEYAWVVINSGMKNTVAERIWSKVYAALLRGETVASAFGHPGKRAALQAIWDDRELYFADYQAADDKLGFLAALPWIGPITKWHLAKNFGVDCAKPDRWLMRLAEAEQTTPDALCSRLAESSGDRVATVDLVLWRACAIGLLTPEANMQPTLASASIHSSPDKETE